MRQNNIPEGGFTLIELVAVIAVIGFLVVASSSFLFSSLSASRKAEVTKQVRESGSYAISVMEALILSSKSVSCGSNESLTTIDVYGGASVFSCGNGQLASNSASLTSTNIEVSNCFFACSLQGAGKPTKVTIRFEATTKDSSGLKPSEKSSMGFSTSVMTRNY